MQITRPYDVERPLSVPQPICSALPDVNLRTNRLSEARSEFLNLIIVPFRNRRIQSIFLYDFPAEMLNTRRQIVGIIVTKGFVALGASVNRITKAIGGSHGLWRNMVSFRPCFAAIEAPVVFPMVSLPALIATEQPAGGSNLKPVRTLHTGSVYSHCANTLCDVIKRHCNTLPVTVNRHTETNGLAITACLKLI